MTIKQIFDLGIKLGRQADWSSWSKNGNSYADSAIHYGRPNQPVKKIMAGIDIKGEELLLAWAMNDIDLVIAHHAVGKAMARLAQVMDVQTGILKHYGVPLRVAKKLINSKKQFNARKLMYLNHDQVVDYAHLINIPLMNLHTPTDNLAADFLCQLVKTNKPQTFASLIKVLGQVPEFKKAKSTGAGLVVFSGQRKNKCQKIFIDCTGGMPGPIEVYQELKKADVDTVVACRQ